MGWTINYYKHKSKEWMLLALGSEDDKKYLAYVQSELWKFLHDRAKSEFDMYLRPGFFASK